MKAKELGIWAGIIAILIGGLWFLISAVNNSPSPSTPANIKIPPISSEDFSIGTPSARITLVEYSDFQCPACKAYAPLITRLSTDFPQDLRVVYRFFPLVNIHQNSMLACQAAYAASLQGKFWEMHDLLFDKQSDWSDINPRDTFISYAKSLNLDVNKFTKDMDADSTKQFITKAINSGTTIGISYTPSIFINGQLIQNPPGYDALKKIVQDALNKK